MRSAHQTPGVCICIAKSSTSNRPVVILWLVSTLRALEHWSIGALEHWSIGALEHWSIGALEYWSIGALEHWSIGVLEYWSIGVFGRARFFLKSSRALAFGGSDCLNWARTGLGDAPAQAELGPGCARYVFSAGHALPRRGCPGLNGPKLKAVRDDFQCFARCETRHRLEAYAMLCYTTPSRGGCGSAELPLGGNSRYRSTLRRAM
jgi:hypothetical protein